MFNYFALSYDWKAAALKSTFIPISAALVGGAVFGPLGAVFGHGVASAIGASIIGFTGVKLIQKKSISNEEIELNSLKDEMNKENSSEELVKSIPNLKQWYYKKKCFIL